MNWGSSPPPDPPRRMHPLDAPLPTYSSRVLADLILAEHVFEYDGDLVRTQLVVKATPAQQALLLLLQQGLRGGKGAGFWGSGVLGFWGSGVLGFHYYVFLGAEE